MRGALGVQIALGGAIEHQRQDHLHEQHRLQVRLWFDRLAQPGLDLGRALLGDDVALAVRSGTRLALAHHHLPVAGQPRQRGIHLPERQRLAPPEEDVVVALEVIAVAGLAFEQAEQRQRNTHNRVCTLSVYSPSIRQSPAGRRASRERVVVVGSPASRVRCSPAASAASKAAPSASVAGPSWAGTTSMAWFVTGGRARSRAMRSASTSTSPAAATAPPTTTRRGSSTVQSPARVVPTVVPASASSRRAPGSPPTASARISDNARSGPWVWATADARARAPTTVSRHP